MRTLSITAAEWANMMTERSGQRTLWLVRDADICTDRRHYILRPSPHNPLGTRRNDVHDDIRCANPCGNAPDGSRRLQIPPVEFVQACAPCETCGGTRIEPYPGGKQHPCPFCRIELVGPMLVESTVETADMWRTVILGHAYAVGEPLPIRSMAERDQWENGIFATANNVYHVNGEQWTDLTDRLAHYGPPESLVGKWALQLEVVA